jgi:hypothetical protein
MRHVVSEYVYGRKQGLEVFKVAIHNIKHSGIVLALIPLLMLSGSLAAQAETVDLEFAEPPASDSDEARTLESVVEVRDTGGPCQTGLYLMTHFGDRDSLFRQENQGLIDNPLINQTWRYCSAFATASGETVLMGRNWDNENVGSRIVSLYQPPGGYSSICFSRAIDMGFPLHMPPDDVRSTQFGRRLLLAPFYAMDGINECGLAVAVTGVRPTTHHLVEDKELVFATFLMRRILDQAKDVEEAVNLVEGYIPFNLDPQSFAGHLLIVDSSGRSVVLEHAEDRWKKTYGTGNWQVLSTKAVYGVADSDLRAGCRRYRTMSESLENTDGDIDWEGGMGILADVAQKGTVWSIVYCPSARDVYFSVYQDWGTVYHLKPF